MVKEPRRKRTSAKSRTVATEDRSVVFDYIKSNYFRVIHADGAIGGVTARGYIHMSLFSERASIPKQIKFSVDKNGHLGDEISRETRGTFIREMEADVFMDEDGAVALHQWLGEKIAQLHELKSKTKQ